MGEKAEREREAYEDAKNGVKSSSSDSSRSNRGSIIKRGQTSSGGTHTSVDLRKASAEDLKGLNGVFSHLPVKINKT
jgi:hypothetical protein